MLNVIPRPISNPKLFPIARTYATQGCFAQFWRAHKVLSGRIYLETGSSQKSELSSSHMVIIFLFKLNNNLSLNINIEQV